MNKFLFTVIASILLNGSFYNNFVNANNSDKFILDSFIKLFDKYYAYFHEKGPFL